MHASDPDRQSEAVTEVALAPTENQRVSGIAVRAPSSAAFGSEFAAGQTLAEGRFRVTRELGRGAMGCVYEAYDEAYGIHVALKTFRGAHASALLALKNEFRALADVMHPNLVELHELICDDGIWFMTMELVQGDNFAQWLAQRRAAGDVFAPDREHELRSWLLQIAQGVAALHGAGKLHRDLKPSNIMLTPDGRVVLLDFGLAEDARASPPEDEHGVVAGTPAYLAPEQAAGQPAAPASDWYALGVMLYEALTGALPFGGDGVRMLWDKQREDAPPVEARTTHAPEDLRRLCARLLERDPSRRAPSSLVLDALAAAMPTSPHAPIPSSSIAEPLGLLGRDEELAALRDVFAAAAQGQVACAWVHGTSGIGKSALLGHFVQGLEARRDTLVLSGRCYERESLPFKACDTLIDALSRRLPSWPAEEIPSRLPQSPRALLRLFPMLERAPWLALGAQLDKPLPTDQQELRREAFASLRELLHQLGARRTLVLHIDDLQWGDLDSAKLLATLLAPPAPAAGLLLLGSFRSDERLSGDLLPALLADQELMRAIAPREIALGPLHEAAALCIAQHALGPRADLALEVAREADGSPFFIAELARHVHEVPEHERLTGRAALADVIEARVARLPRDARALLEVVAVAGRPVESGVALRASELRRTDRRVLTRLQAAHLLRARRTEHDEWLETYHDRVRDAVVRALGEPSRRHAHHAIAQTLEAEGKLDAERLALHFREAGAHERAASYAARAGDDAYRALAFERAATWYAAALDVAGLQGPRQQALRVRLGDALTHAGRGAQAAEHYLSAARLAARNEALELERRAAEQLLISGHRSRGLATLSAVLKESGIAAPDQGSALARLLWQRLRLRVRGTEFSARPAADVDAEVLRRVDACGVAARTLLVREPVKGAIFGTMHLKLALDAGEPSRIVEGLATEIMYTATEGVGSAARVEHLIARARAIDLSEQEPAAQAYLRTALAARALLYGRFAEATATASEAEAIYRERCTGVTGPLNLARSIWAPAVLFMGDFPAGMSALAGWLEDARQREDLEAQGQLSVYRLYGALAADDVEAVREGLRPALSRWRPGHRETAGMTAVHVLAVLECYAQASPTVLAHVRELYQPFFRSFLARVQLYRVVVMGYSANLELAIAAQGHQRAFRLRRARVLAARLHRERVRHAAALAHLVEAGSARLRGDLDGAVRHLEQSCADFEADHQMLWAACARMRLGKLLGGSQGKAHDERARRDMQARGIVAPERFVSVYAPGYPD